LKRPDLFPLLQKSIGLGLRTTLTPSATPLLTESAIEGFQEIGVARMAISLDGPDAATCPMDRRLGCSRPSLLSSRRGHCVLDHGEEHHHFALRLNPVFQVWAHVDERTLRRLLLLTTQPQQRVSFQECQRGRKGRRVRRELLPGREAEHPRVLQAVRPWLRGGYDYGSGDGNPSDNTHGTFFQVLPTPRVYARFPFFNMMNSRDVFGELILRPGKAVSVRADVHSLALANRNDLWYSGGGMFQPWTFGYAGRPADGQAGLATLYDVSADYTVNHHVSIGAYFGHATGKSVVEPIYPSGAGANFGYLEFTFHL